MPHRFGALLLPAPAPASESNAVGDPGLDVLADYFAAILRFYLATAWQAVATAAEPVVRVISKDDPGERDFHEGDLPLLCVWRSEDTSPTRLSDAHQETNDTLNVLWIPPPTTQIFGRERSPFFAAFKKAVSLAVQQERDPCYLHEIDAARGQHDPQRHEAESYGSDVHELAGLDGWRIRRFQRVPVDVPTDDGVFSYPGYLAQIQIYETSGLDFSPATRGIYPTKVAIDVVTPGPDPLLLQQALVTGDFSSDFSLAFDGGVPGSFSPDFSEDFH